MVYIPCMWLENNWHFAAVKPRVYAISAWSCVCCCCLQQQLLYKGMRQHICDGLAPVFDLLSIGASSMWFEVVFSKSKCKFTVMCGLNQS